MINSNKKVCLLKNSQADYKLKNLLKNNNNLAWNILYDRYAAVMYGNILNITKNKALAEEIFITAFIRLKNDNKNVPLQCSIALYLCAYVKKITTEYMKQNISLN